MRRPTRFGLAAFALLLILLGVYTAYWLIVVGQIKSGVTAWAQAVRADKIDVSWEGIEVGGFPFSCRVSLKAATVRDHRLSPAPELRIPVLSGEARPWDFATWRLDAPGGLSAALAAGSDFGVSALASALDVSPAGWTLAADDVASDMVTTALIAGSGPPASAVWVCSRNGGA